MNNLFKLSHLVIFTALPFTSVYADAQVSNKERMLQKQLSVCGSLNLDPADSADCIENNFSYPILDVQYPLGNGDLVSMQVRQALAAGSKIVNSDVSLLSSQCSECDGSDASILSHFKQIAPSMLNAEKNGTLLARVKGSTADRKAVLLTETFAEPVKKPTANVTVIEKFKGLFRSENEHIQPRNYLIVTDSSGKAVAGGWIKHTELSIDVRLLPAANAHGRMSWTGNVDINLIPRFHQNWHNFSGGDTRCRVSYSGADGTMLAQVTCSPE